MSPVVVTAGITALAFDVLVSGVTFLTGTYILKRRNKFYSSERVTFIKEMNKREVRK